MLVVADRGVYPFAQPVFVKASRVQLVAQVPVHVVHNHQKEENEQVQKVDRQHVQKHHKDTGFHQRLQRMKRIGRPRRRVGTLVMHQVKMFEKPFVVHQPVGPVKVGIVYQEQKRKGAKKIGPAVLRYIGIKGSGAGNGGYVQHQQRHQGKNADGKDRIADLTCIIFGVGCAGLYFLNPTRLYSSK